MLKQGVVSNRDYKGKEITLDLVSLKRLPREAKILLLRELGYASDGVFVTNIDGQKVIDRYIEEPVKVENMLIMPGSDVILDSNPISIAGYFEDHPERI